MTTTKPSPSEDEYFAREETEKKRRLILDQVKAMGQAERDQLKATHHMRCPKCGMQLQEIAVRGVWVDKCFNCHGVYLDAGELEKLASDTGYWSRMLRFFARKDYDSQGQE